MIHLELVVQRFPRFSYALVAFWPRSQEYILEKVFFHQMLNLKLWNEFDLMKLSLRHECKKKIIYFQPMLEHVFPDH